MSTSYPRASSLGGAFDFLGIPVHPVQSESEVHAYIEQVIHRKEKAVLYNLNIHAINLTFKDRKFLEFIQDAQLVFCDGDGPRWGMKMLGHSPPIKMGTTRWIWLLAEFCSQKGYSLFLLGSKPGVAEQAAEKLSKAYSGLRIAGTHHGYFEKTGPECDEVIAGINEVKPDILMTCFGMPVQEQWIAENRGKLNAHIFLKGGAVLDYVAGRLGEAPDWMLKLHLEWLFRIWEEPGRLAGRYLHDIPVFFWRVLKEKMRKT